MKKIIIALMVLMAVLNANAQKQPQVQGISLRAPDNVKIDGKIDEWPNPFLNAKKTNGFLQASNSTSRIYYTISNDNNNLYFIIRGFDDYMLRRKFLVGGINITISHMIDKKREKALDNVVIKFPKPQNYKIANAIIGIIANAEDLDDENDATNRKRIDSLDVIANKKLNETLTEINIIGVKEFPDQNVSVYNTEGVRAAAAFLRKQPVIEVAIPLKYLNLSIDDAVKFSYNIKINAEPEVVVAQADLPKALPHGVDMNAPVPRMDPPGSNDSFYMVNTTDFWGMYTLAKKP